MFILSIYLSFGFTQINWKLPGCQWSQFDGTPVEELAHAVRFSNISKINQLINS